MFDMRYHIASLMSVFLALALGILLGTSIVNKGILVKQQQKLIESIDESITNVKEKNRLLSNQVTAYKEFEDSIFNSWAPNLLAKRKVAIIVFDNDSDKEQESKAFEWLQSAGAQTTTVNLKMDFFKMDITDEEYKKKYESLYKLFPEPATVAKKKIHSYLFAELLGKSVPQVIKELENIKVLTIEDEKIYPFDGIVFVAGSNKKLKTEQTEVELALAADNLVKTTIVESSKIIPSGLTPFIDERLSTIDNIDNGSGGISLISLLVDKKGNFGIKEDAQKITPLSK